MAKGDLYWMGTNKMKARMHYQMDCHGRNTKYVILFLCTTSYIYIYCMNFPKTYLIQYKSTQLRKSSSHLGIILNHWLGDIQLRRVLGLHARGRRFCIFSLAFFLRREWFQIEWLTPNWWIICFILCSWCWILNVYIVSCLLLETSIMS